MTGEQRMWALIVTVVLSAFIGVVSIGTSTAVKYETMKTERFKTCVVAHDPAVCRLSTESVQ